VNGLLVIVIALGFAALCIALVALADLNEDDE
jgi:hypothetical protein